MDFLGDDMMGRCLLDGELAEKNFPDMDWPEVNLDGDLLAPVDAGRALGDATPLAMVVVALGVIGLAVLTLLFILMRMKG